MNDGGRWLLGNYRQAIAIRRRNGGHCRDVIQPVVGVALGAAVEVLLLGQPIPGIPREPIAFAVLVDQRLQPPIAVIAELHLPAMGVGALAYLAATVVLVERGVPGRVGVAHQLTADIALIALNASVRQLAAEQTPVGVIAELSAFAEGVGDDLQIASLVIAEARGVTRAVNVLDQLPERIPPQLLAFTRGVDDFHDLSMGVVAIASDMTQRIGFGDAVATRVVAILPTVVGRVGFHLRQGPMLQPQRRIAAPQRVTLADQITGLVIAVFITPTLRIGGAEQLAFVVPLEQPGLAEVVAVLDDLVLRVPQAGADAPQTVGDAREAGLQVIVELVSVAFIGPMPDHTPFQVFNQRPFVKTP